MIRTGNRMSFYNNENINNGITCVTSSFPFVFGYENIYRQFYIYCFFSTPIL